MEVTDKKFIYLLSGIIKIFLTIWILQYAADVSLNGYFDFDKYERKSEYGGVSLRNYPYKAVDFMVGNKVKGNFLNDFNTGAYLVGRCFPDVKVFIDGRTEVYGPDYFKNYQQIFEKENVDLLKETLEKYQITGAILTSVYNPIPKHMVKYFYEDEAWVPVYFDYDAVIFLKDVPLHKEIIAAHTLDFTKWEPITLDLYRLGSKKITPVSTYQSRLYVGES